MIDLKFFTLRFCDAKNKQKWRRKVFLWIMKQFCVRKVSTPPFEVLVNNGTQWNDRVDRRGFSLQHQSSLKVDTNMFVVSIRDYLLNSQTHRHRIYADSDWINILKFNAAIESFFKASNNLWNHFPVIFRELKSNYSLSSPSSSFEVSCFKPSRFFIKIHTTVFLLAKYFHPSLAHEQKDPLQPEASSAFQDKQSKGSFDCYIFSDTGSTFVNIKLLFILRRYFDIISRLDLCKSGFKIHHFNQS